MKIAYFFSKRLNTEKIEVKRIKKIGQLVDYVIASVAETTIMDVYEYKAKETHNDKPEYEQ